MCDILLSSKEIKRSAKEVGFQDCGIARAKFLGDEYELFRTAILANRHASMRFLEKDIEKRFNPEYLLPGCKTVVVVTYNYLTDSAQKTDKYLIARYAHIRDYHTVVNDALDHLANTICTGNPLVKYRITVDSSAISEKNWAVRSGVGRYGKNGLIHNDKGSFFIIGILLLNQFCDEYDHASPISDCGSCELCIRNCPTNALETPFSLDANRCVSYLNTEAKTPNYSELAKEKYIFGCDICQEVCPKNKKNITNALNVSKTSLFLPLENSDYEGLTKERFSQYFADTSIIRRKYDRFRAMIDAKRAEQHL